MSDEQATIKPVESRTLRTRDEKKLNDFIEYCYGDGYSILNLIHTSVSFDAEHPALMVPETLVIFVKDNRHSQMYQEMLASHVAHAEGQPAEGASPEGQPLEDKIDALPFDYDHAAAMVNAGLVNFHEAG